MGLLLIEPHKRKKPMSRMPVPSRDDAPAASKPLLDAVNAQLGVIPNFFRLVGQSPAALEGFLGLQGALGKTLDVKTRERIALAVAQVNGCDYCLSAHTYLGANVAKMDAVELAANRNGHSNDAKGHRDLTIILLSQLPTILSRHANRVSSLLRHTGIVDDPGTNSGAAKASQAGSERKLLHEFVAHSCTAKGARCVMFLDARETLR
jgi:AhpD family alkylhydroperoxidase